MKVDVFRKAVYTFGISLTLAVLGVSSLRQAQAAPAAAGAAAFGSVDVDKIVAGYTKKADYDTQVQAYNQHLDAQFKQQVNYPMLDKNQQARLGVLLSKASPTDPERAEMTQLEDQSTKDAQELAGLQQKKDATDADRARMDVLLKQHDAGQQALQDIAAGYQEQAKQHADIISAQLSDTVKAAVVAVAKEKDLAVVFDSHVAIYTANDITQDVLKRLNK